MIRRLDNPRRDTGPNGPEACDHSATELLGLNRGVTFLRCRVCGHVLVIQGGKAWAIRPPRSAR